MGWKNGLRNTEVRHSPHLGEALPCRGPGMRDIHGIASGEQVARGEPGIVVRGTHQAVEIDFSSMHDTFLAA